MNESLLIQSATVMYDGSYLNDFRSLPARRVGIVEVIVVVGVGISQISAGNAATGRSIRRSILQKKFEK